MLAPFQQPRVISYSHSLADSFERWTGKHLLEHFSAEALYRAPFVLVSHGVQDDPVFCYVNLAAQTLWNMEWETFTRLPSRLSAEPDAREERARLLAQAEAQGYVDHYRGVRVTSDGRRFAIQDCILWNVADNDGMKIGQAAMFTRWEWL